MTTAEKTVLRPLGDRLVVVRQEADQETPGGIVLPEQSREQPLRGRVVATGPGRLLEDGRRAALEVAEGDTVMFSRYGGSEIEIDGEEFLVLSESDVLLVLS